MPLRLTSVLIASDRRSGFPDRAEHEPNHRGNSKRRHWLVGDRLVDGALDVASHFLHAFRRLAALVRYAAGDVLGLTCKVFDGIGSLISQIVDF